MTRQFYIQTTFLLLSIFPTLGQLVTKSNQTDPADLFLKMMNDTIHNIKYVFEARVDSVQAFPGDKNGNPIPFSKGNWKNGGAKFDIGNTRQAIVYSKVWVSICRAYKGKLPKKIILLIPNTHVTAFAEVRPNGDTTLGYLQQYVSHGDTESPLLPSKSYPITLLYWCFDVSQTNVKGVYTMNKFFNSPMKLQGTVPNNRGYYDHAIIYALLGTKSFMNQAELSSYLKQIRTLKANPRPTCN
ncbi:MAG: hypothetical protein PSX81_07740 [bacterium]|nr:hypothetical protein [bacterium]